MIITEDDVRRCELASIADSLLLLKAFHETHPDWRAVGQELDSGVLLLLGPGSYVNRAMAVGLDGPVETRTIARVEALSAEMAVPPAFELCPLVDAGLLEELGRRCYRVTGFRTILLRELGPGAPSPATSAATVAPTDTEIDIELVTDDAGLAQWQANARMGFGLHDQEAQAVSDRFSAARYRTEGEHLFLARIGGEVAGGGSLTVRDGLATLGGMATTPAFRRRGVQAALVAHRLRYAADQGCDLARVGADPGTSSERNLQRGGFSIGYNQVFMSGPEGPGVGGS